MTASASVDDIKKLRNMTGAGVLDCREALEGADGDVEKAVVLLREKGLSKAAKRAGRETHNGRVELYSHGDGRIGVMVEVNCETDFVARTKEFLEFAHEVALQVAAESPGWIAEQDVPEEVIEQERDIARKLALEEGKPDDIVDRIVDGRMVKFYGENCLLLQEYIRDADQTIEDLLKELIVATGENITIRRFERWTLGEELA
jgi:elongation factor Ts